MSYETTLCIRFGEDRYFFDIVIMGSVVEQNGSKGLDTITGECFLYWKGCEWPSSILEVVVSCDSIYVADVLFDNLCRISVKEARTVALWLVRRERREVAKSEPESRAKRGKNFRENEILRYENENLIRRNGKAIYTLRSRLQLLGGGSCAAAVEAGSIIPLPPSRRCLAPPVRLEWPSRGFPI